MRKNEKDLDLIPEEKSLTEREKRKNQKSRSKRNHEMILISYLFFGLFICMIGYLIYFQTVQSSEVITSPYNKRQDTFADRVVRGEIQTGDGTTIARTEVASDGSEKRVYPYGNMFSHVVGYSSRGKTGIELLANYQLLTSNAYFVERFWNEVEEKKNIGDNVVTTLDLKLQQTAYDALGSSKGAVIAMEPSTGKLLAMVSKPDFDPNSIESNWNSVSTGADSVLVNRATQGKYPPGSTFKIITLLEYLREGNDPEEFSYDCSGSLTVDDVTINCYHGSAHGEEDLKKAFAKSCNGAFADIGLSLNPKKLSSLCSDLLFNSSLPLELPYNESSFALNSKADTGTKMQISIGQGATEVTPMHMALLTSAIANGGNLMNPYLIDHIENYQGSQIKKYMPSSYGKLLSAGEAASLTEYMTEVVENGTASALAGLSYSVAGKTGTAEYTSDKSKSHAWFVGFSNVEDPDLVVCVLVEEKGSGSEYAVPIAKKIFEAYHN